MRAQWDTTEFCWMRSSALSETRERFMYFSLHRQPLSWNCFSQHKWCCTVIPDCVCFLFPGRHFTETPQLPTVNHEKRITSFKLYIFLLLSVNGCGIKALRNRMILANTLYVRINYLNFSSVLSWRTYFVNNLLIHIFIYFINSYILKQYKIKSS